MRGGGEGDCRDEIVDMLGVSRPKLDYTTESRSAKDKIVDIVVQINKNLILPIEVKGQWNPELRVGIEGQLDKYYIEGDYRAEHGIYLVLWFGKEYTKGFGGKKPETPEELKMILEKESKSVKDGKAKVFVLDFTKLIKD